MGTLNIERKKSDHSYFSPWLTELFGFPFFDEGKHYELLKTDILENDFSYLLFIEAPGCKKEDITINYEGEYLKVQVKFDNYYKTEGKWIKNERNIKFASRNYYIGKLTDKEIKASLDDGILVISVPKESNTSDLSKKIEII